MSVQLSAPTVKRTSEGPAGQAISTVHVLSAQETGLWRSVHSNQLKNIYTFSIFINAPFPLLYRFLMAGTVFMKILFISRIIIIIIIISKVIMFT